MGFFTPWNHQFLVTSPVYSHHFPNCMMVGLTNPMISPWLLPSSHHQVTLSIWYQVDGLSYPMISTYCIWNSSRLGKNIPINPIIFLSYSHHFPNIYIYIHILFPSYYSIYIYIYIHIYIIIYICIYNMYICIYIHLSPNFKWNAHDIHHFPRHLSPQTWRCKKIKVATAGDKTKHGGGLVQNRHDEDNG